MTYAKHTGVSSESSVAEIRKTLRRYSATSFAQFEGDGKAAIAFEIKGLRIRMSLTMPKVEAFAHTPEKRRARTDASRNAAWEQACRSHYRALALVVKAKLEAVESGISVLEDEFLAHVVMPDGKTVGEHVRPQIAIAYKTGVTPPLLAGPEARP